MAASIRFQELPANTCFPTFYFKKERVTNHACIASALKILFDCK